MSDARAAALQRLLTERRPALFLEAHDAVSAQLVEEAGFDGIWASSLTVACSLGVRDGDLDMTRTLDVVEAMTRRVAIPVLTDGGMGGETDDELRFLVRELARRGAAGVCIEDKAPPKRNSFVAPESQTLLSADHFCRRLQEGLQGIGDRELVIVARTEALIVGEDVSQALSRARAYVDAGAHAVLVHSRRGDFAQVAAFMEQWDLEAPVLCVPTTYGATPFRQFEEAGLGAVIWANHMLRSAVAAMSQSARRLRETRSSVSIEDHIVPVSRLLTLQGEDIGSLAIPTSAPGAAAPADARQPDAPGAVVGALLRAGVTDASGVPCTILEPLQQAIERSELRYVAASVEGESVALAAGAWLAGQGGAVLLQNSGLGNAVNPLVSLALPYRIPLLLVVSWRGQPGTADAPHHKPMGALTLPLLEQLGTPSWVLDDCERADALVERAASWALHERRVAALVVPRSTFTPAPVRVAAEGMGNGRKTADGPLQFIGGPPASRATVIERYRALYDPALAISTTGFCSRALHASGAADHHFYMQGSMGFALAIGLGLARCTDDPVFVLDGDGALIMRMGTMATVGAARPHNLIHIVMDNRAYASTGGQPTASVSFPEVALACGYARAALCEGIGELDAALAWAGDEPGPTLLHVRIAGEESTRDLSRPESPPEVVAERFRLHVNQTRSARKARPV